MTVSSSLAINSADKRSLKNLSNCGKDNMIPHVKTDQLPNYYGDTIVAKRNCLGMVIKVGIWI